MCASAQGPAQRLTGGQGEPSTAERRFLPLSGRPPDRGSSPLEHGQPPSLRSTDNSTASWGVGRQQSPPFRTAHRPGAPKDPRVGAITIRLDGRELGPYQRRPSFRRASRPTGPSRSGPGASGQAAVLLGRGRPEDGTPGTCRCPTNGLLCELVTHPRSRLPVLVE